MIAWTPNPALDLSGEVTSLIPDEKNLVHSMRRDPGGNAINAGRIASRLGAPITHVFWSGGATGLEVQALLKNENQRVHSLPLAAPLQTRTNITVTQQKTRTQTRLSFPGPKISGRDMTQLLRFAERHDSPSQPWLIGGSLPPRMSVSSLIRVLKTLRGVPIYLDVPGPILRELCPLQSAARPRWRAHLMKPNLQELSQLWGKPIHGEKQIQTVATRLKPYTRWICVSMGANGALLGDLDHPGHWWRGKSPDVIRRGTVGAGDSMLGAMAWAGLRNPKTDGATLLRWGLAAGAATASSPGSSLGTKGVIRQLFRAAVVQPL